MNNDNRNFMMFAVLAVLLLFAWPLVMNKIMPPANPPVTKIEGGKTQIQPNPGAPTAVFVANDLMALGLIRALNEGGLHVPRDLSVVGFDDTSAATMVWPELTTIRQPVAAMADCAVDILLRSIRRKEQGSSVLVDQVVAHQLIKRDSVASPQRQNTRRT